MGHSPDRWQIRLLQLSFDNQESLELATQHIVSHHTELKVYPSSITGLAELLKAENTTQNMPDK